MSSRLYQVGWATLACLALLLCLPASPTVAQPTPEQQNAIRSNCRSDYMANCSSVKPGGPEALQCLRRNVAKLSSACQTAVNAASPPSAPQQATAAPASPPAVMPAPVSSPPPAAAVTPAAPAAPAAQVRAPAATPPAQPARTATAAPAAQPPQQPSAQQKAAIRQSCQSDFMARCSGVQPGGADALRCLQRNSAQLSPSCHSAVAALGGAAPAAAPAAAQAAAPTLASAPTSEQQSAVKFTCRRDFTTNCRGVTPGGPEALACLQRNAAKVSPDCRTSLAAITEDAPVAAAGSAAAAPAARPGLGGPFPLRRAIRERMMNQ
jgi:hypothetical protein